MIAITPALTPAQKKEIQDLEAHYSPSFSFPYEEEDCLYLIQTQTDTPPCAGEANTNPDISPRITSLQSSSHIAPAAIVHGMAVCALAPGAFEIIAFTHPRYVRQGYFTKSCQILCSFLKNPKNKKSPDPKIRSFLAFVSPRRPLFFDFPCDESLPAGIHAVKSLGARYQNTQLTMKYVFGAIRNASFSKKRNYTISPGETPGEYKIFQTQQGFSAVMRNMHKRLPQASRQAAPGPWVPIGRFFLEEYGNHTFYFYGFTIFPDFRGKGLGRTVMGEILSLIRQKGATSLLLQVEKENIPAHRIYEGLGFGVKEKVVYYGYFYSADNTKVLNKKQPI